MADVLLSSGTVISVSHAAPATYDAAGFALLTYTAIGELESFGDVGGKAQLTNFIPLGTGVIKKLKGSTDYGTASAVVGLLDGNAGQTLLKNGFDGPAQFDLHSFKIVSSDGAIMYFTGLITSFVITVGGANDVRKATCEVALNNKLLSDLFS